MTASKRAGEIVAASYFEHIPVGVGGDTRYVLERRDVNNDGQLDEVGYPLTRVYEGNEAYARPFTLAGETEDSFSYGSGPNQVIWHSGDRVTSSDLMVFDPSVRFARNQPDHVLALTGFSLRLAEDSTEVSTGGYYLYPGHAYLNLQIYASTFARILFKEMIPAERDEVFKKASAYLKKPDPKILEEILHLMNNWYAANEGSKTASASAQYSVPPPMSDDQIALLAKVGHQNRRKFIGFLVQGFKGKANFTNFVNHQGRLRDLFATFVEHVFSSFSAMVSSYVFGNGKLDLGPQATAELDTLFGPVRLFVETADPFKVPVSTLKPAPTN